MQQIKLLRTLPGARHAGGPTKHLAPHLTRHQVRNAAQTIQGLDDLPLLAAADVLSHHLVDDVIIHSENLQSKAFGSWRQLQWDGQKQQKHAWCHCWALAKASEAIGLSTSSSPSLISC